MEASSRWPEVTESLASNFMCAEKEHEVATLPAPSGGRVTLASIHQTQARSLVWMMAVLIICFIQPLYHLTIFAKSNELYSYILLMPFVTIYLVWPKRETLWSDARPERGFSILFFVAGGLFLLGYWLAVRDNWTLTMEDRLAFTISAFFLCLCGVFCFWLGRKALGPIALPLGLLAFMIPMPSYMLAKIETALQYGSAIVADWMFKLSFTTYSRAGLDFKLPGIDLRVAPECSGIHSTWILLITSLLAGYLFLRSPRKRCLLALAVIPLALLRNGFRIFTIGELCIHIGPEMIDSPIHHRGGPIFFVLSLIPFLIMLTMLHRSEIDGGKVSSVQS